MVESRTYGAEIEKPVSNLETGQPYGVSQGFFRQLAQLAIERGEHPQYHNSDLNGEIIGVKTNDLGEQGVDNGWNLLETSLPYQTSLLELQKLMSLDLAAVQEALKAEGATLINLSIHPLGKRDLISYAAFVAPKGIYPYLWYRGWDHTAGIDARAQNSPTTGVKPHEAADAVSVVIGVGAAFIGLFANSPYEEGKRSDCKESRLKMWERMMRFAKVEGDRLTAQFPPCRFRTMADYFNWMFGDKTGIHFVIASNKGNEYKSIGDQIIIIPDNPSVIDFLSQSSWQGLYLRDLNSQNFPPQTVVVHPHISHMEAMQFAQFAGARVRYRLNVDDFPLENFLEALKNPQSQKVEEIFSQYAEAVWIEGRDSGANFPDEEIIERGDEIAQSIIVAPSAIQAGLIRNLKRSSSFVDSYDWGFLRELREAAIRKGLEGEVDGISVYDFAKKVLEIAADGLTSEEQKLLAYPLSVIETRKNGADRAIEFVERYSGSFENALVSLVKARSLKTEI